MNTVYTTIEALPKHFERGDIFKSSRGLFYILAFISGTWVAVGLADGNYWTTPTIAPEDAVKSLIFIGRDRAIEII